MIEKAPNINIMDTGVLDKMITGTLLDNIASSVFDLQKIEEQYLYWDKIKYIQNETVKDLSNLAHLKPNELLWYVVKFKRKTIQKINYFEGYETESVSYNYNVNEHLQKTFTNYTSILEQAYKKNNYLQI